MSSTLNEALLAVRLRRLASQHPVLRPHLAPLLAKHAEHVAADQSAFANVKLAHPALTAERWASATCLEKYAATRRVAHKPILLSDGLTIQKVREHEAFMVYRVDPVKNNSKFYEAIILPSDDGSFRLKRRWGALTDSGQTGRIDGGKFDFDRRFSGLSLSQAKGVLAKVYRDRMDHGYTDAFGPNHVTPDGKKLPSGQYPVGLSRKVDFGWGTQSVAFCIPALRQVQSLLSDAQQALRSGDTEGASASQNLAEQQAKQVLKADSSMGQKILDNIEHMQGRASLVLSGRGDDREVANWTVAMSRLMSYIDKQLSLCNGGKMASGKSNKSKDALFAHQKKYGLGTKAYWTAVLKDVKAGVIHPAEIIGGGDKADKGEALREVQRELGKSAGTRKSAASRVKPWDNSAFFSPEQAKTFGDRRVAQYIAFMDLTPGQKWYVLGKYHSKCSSGANALHSGVLGPKYAFAPEHYYYPVTNKGDIKGRRVLAIPLAKIKDDRYMASLGYEMCPDWIEAQAQGRVADRNR